MEVEQQIQSFISLIEQEYIKKLIKHINEDKKRLTIEFRKLVQHDPNLAEELLENPAETIKAGEIAIEQFDTYGDVRNFKVRIKGVPLSNKYRIKDIRSKHIGKLIILEGYIKVKSDIRPNMTSVKYECPSCGNMINVLQMEEVMKEPSQCGCGRRGKFRLIEKELIDAYSLVIEEPPEMLRMGTKLGRQRVLLKHDLCDINIEERLYQGARVRITGILKEVMLHTKGGGKKTTLDFCLDANYVDFLESSPLDFKLSTKDIEEITEYLRQPDILKKLRDSLFKGIYSMDRVKEGIIMAVLEGKTDINTAPITNGKIMILLIGDPGQGKTTCMEALMPFLVKARFASGKGASGVGILGAVVKDELTGGFGFEAGALALAHQGVLFLDEIDKMDEKDRDALHQPMSQLKFDISKASIQSTLLAETTIIAGANPKLGRFDIYSDLYSQIDLPDTLINRFDLIFVLKQGTDQEAINEEEQKALTQLMRRKHPIFEKDIIFFKKLFSYLVRLEPIIPDEVGRYIAKKYTQLLSKGLRAQKKYIPITQRQVTSIAKIAEAHAKLFKGHIAKDNAILVDESDVDYAIDLLHYSFKDIAFDPESGQMDFDKISIGISMSERSNLTMIKEIIQKLEDKVGKVIPLDDIAVWARQANVKDDAFEKIIARLKREGEIFEPRRGFIARLE